MRRELLFTFLIFGFMAQAAIAQTKYVNSGSGANLRKSPSTSAEVVTSMPQNTKVKVIKTEGDWTQVEVDGKRGYVSSSLLSDEPVKKSSSNNQKSSSSSKSNSGSSSRSNSGGSSSITGGGGYQTAIGLRGGFTSGLTVKHFLNETNAIEGIIGSRWFGLNIAGLYTWHFPAFATPGLKWQLGVGGRVGFYEGRYYYRHLRRNSCNDPNNPNCYAYWERRSFTAIGVLGIGGLEYQFADIPLTLSLDFMPNVYINHYGPGFIDASFSIRYILK